MGVRGSQRDDPDFVPGLSVMDDLSATVGVEYASDSQASAEPASESPSEANHKENSSSGSERAASLRPQEWLGPEPTYLQPTVSDITPGGEPATGHAEQEESPWDEPLLHTSKALGNEDFASLAKLKHDSGQCNPCAYFILKGDGCRNGVRCTFCHFCNREDIGRRKRQRAKQTKAKAKAMRAATEEQELLQLQEHEQAMNVRGSPRTTDRRPSLTALVQEFGVPEMPIPVLDYTVPYLTPEVAYFALKYSDCS